jgi:type I restriction enzyme S subunit
VNTWPMVRLGDVAEVSGGNSAPQAKDAFVNGQTPFIRTSDVGAVHVGEISNSRDRLPQIALSSFRVYAPGAILIPKSGASTFTNHRVITTVDAAISSHLAVIVADEARMLPRYCFYAMLSVDSRDLVQDQSYPSLPLSVISEIEIPLPPLDEQKRIVAKLDKAARDLANLNDKDAKRHQFEAALFSILTRDVMDVDNSPQVPLGELLDTVIDHRGKTPEKLGGEFLDEGVRVISAIHIKRGQIHWERRDRFVSHEMFQKWMRVPLRRGDVLLTSEAPLGEVALVPDDEPLVLSQRLYGLRVSKDRLLDRYLAHFLSSDFGQRQLRSRQSGATAVGIKQSELLKVLVPVPPLAEQVRICDVLDEAVQMSENLDAIRLKRIVAIQDLGSMLVAAGLRGDL